MCSCISSRQNYRSEIGAMAPEKAAAMWFLAKSYLCVIVLGIILPTLRSAPLGRSLATRAGRCGLQRFAAALYGKATRSDDLFPSGDHPTTEPKSKNSTAQ